jgi:phosphatidylinositol 4-kinase B
MDMLLFDDELTFIVQPFCFLSCILINTRQVFVMQMIKYFIRIFRIEDVPVWLLPYTIMSTSQTTGLIQLIPNAQSLDAMKKSAYWPGSLRGYFEKTYGSPDSAAFQQAVSAYISSMAGYSVVCYILSIKDR